MKSQKSKVKRKTTYETVELQQLLREIAGRTASEHDADAIRLAADTLDALTADGKHITDDIR